MELLLLAALAYIVYLLLSRFNATSNKLQVLYRRRPYLLSKAERSFYGVLIQAVNGNALVFSKVRVADVLAPVKGLNRSNWQQSFNRISAKHFDFILCDPLDCSIKLAIELDDASHGSLQRQKRDAFLEKACESANLPLLRVKAARGYVITDIRHQIGEIIPGVIAADTTMESPTEGADHPAGLPQENSGAATLERSAQEESHVDEGHQEVESEASAPICGQCGAEMVLRKARTGKQIGQKFWGCSRFPACRETRPVDSGSARCKT